MMEYIFNHILKTKNLKQNQLDLFYWQKGCLKKKKQTTNFQN